MWFNKVTTCVWSLTTFNKFCITFSSIDKIVNTLKLGFTDQRTKEYIFKWISNFKSFSMFFETFNKFIINFILYEYTWACTTALTLIKPNTKCCSFNCILKICIIKYDGWGFTSKLKCRLLDSICWCFED